MISKKKSIEEYYNIFFNLIKNIQNCLIKGDKISIIKYSDDLIYYIDICFKHEKKIFKDNSDKIDSIEKFEKDYKQKISSFIRSIQKNNFRRASTLLYYLKGSFYDRIVLQKLI